MQEIKSAISTYWIFAGGRELIYTILHPLVTRRQSSSRATLCISEKTNSIFSFVFFFSCEMILLYVFVLRNIGLTIIVSNTTENRHLTLSTPSWSFPPTPKNIHFSIKCCLFVLMLHVSKLIPLRHYDIIVLTSYGPAWNHPKVSHSRM